MLLFYFFIVGLLGMIIVPLLGLDDTVSRKAMRHAFITFALAFLFFLLLTLTVT